MDISAHIAELAKQQKIKSKAWVPGPFLDTLFDYEGFLKAGPIGSPGNGGKTVIIGAGISGLIAGYELLRAGIPPVIYEASDRIGGRLYTKDMGGGALAELGAMRVPTSHKTVWHYADHFGVPRAPFPDPGKVFTQLYYRGKTLDWHPPHPAPGPFSAIAEDFGTMMKPFVNAIYPAWQSGDLDKVRALWQLMISRHLVDTFYGAVHRGTVWTAQEMQAFGALGLGSGGFGPMFEIDFVSALRYVLEQHNVGLKLFTDGLGDFVDRIVDEPFETASGTLCVRDCIQTDSKIVGLDKAGDQTVLRFASGETVHADAVIVAMSSRAAEMIGLTLPMSNGDHVFPEPVRQSLRTLHMTAASKLFIKTSTKFWKGRSDLPEMIMTDDLPKSLYCLDYPGTDKGVILMSYTWEDDAATVSSLAPDVFFDKCLAVFERANPAFAKELVPEDGDFLKIDWVNEPLYHGGFQLPQPGQEPLVKSAYYQYQTALSRDTDTGIYLSGDSFSWQGGWMEGAMRTGVNAACAALLRVGGTVRENSPMDVNPDQFRYA
jgi:tryptophan 2-monooxygenase